MMLSNEIIRREAERRRLAAEVDRYLASGGEIRLADSGHRHAVEAITERARIVRFGDRNIV